MRSFQRHHSQLSAALKIEWNLKTLRCWTHMDKIKVRQLYDMIVVAFSFDCFCAFFYISFVRLVLSFLCWPIRCFYFASTLRIVLLACAFNYCLILNRWRKRNKKKNKIINTVVAQSAFYHKGSYATGWLSSDQSLSFIPIDFRFNMLMRRLIQ